jgi:hypothetical protein
VPPEGAPGPGVGTGSGKPTILGGILAADLTLSGPATLTEDLLIPAGVTLTLLPGAVVTVVPADGSLTNPPFLLPGTEIMVHGTIRAPGGKALFRPGLDADGKPGRWGGIVLPRFPARAELGDSVLEGAEQGVLDLRGPFAPGAWKPDFVAQSPVLPAAVARTREYIGEAALAEDTVWEGEVVIDGQVAVPPGVTLTIRPGARVLFRWRDTDGDRLGESWIVVQGRLRVEGSEDAWVLFDAAPGGEGPEGAPGSWDSVSLISSDAPDNLVRYAVFRHAVKGFHDHFSRVALENVVFTDNLRGLQFQESEGLTLDRATFARNRSAMRFRDSTAALSNLVVAENLSGANFLRSRVTVSDSLFCDNRFESLQSREAEITLARCAFTGNQQGPRFKGTGEPVSIADCLVRGSAGEGLSLQKVKAKLTGCELSGNGSSGLAVTDAEVTVRDSRLAWNGGLEVDNNGATTVDAEGNDWGDGRSPDPARIHDAADEQGIGPVLTGRALARPRLLLFPGLALPEGGFAGTLSLAGDVSLPADKTLGLLPGARVLFVPAPPGSLFDLCSDHPSFPGGELVVAGRIEARGTSAEPVTFAGRNREAGQGEAAAGGVVNLFGAAGGAFSHCLFTGLETGLHASGAGAVGVSSCRFEQNIAGLRFSGTTMTVRDSTFRANTYGIRFHDFGGTVERCEFYDNRTALFVTDAFSGIAFSGNTFAGSAEYDVKLGEEAVTDLDMRGNRFLSLGTGRKAEELVFDKSRDPALGRVLLP